MSTNKDYSKLTKVEVQQEVFRLLGLNHEETDNSENTESGGGSTITRDAWIKVLNKIAEILNEKN